MYGLVAELVYAGDSKSLSSLKRDVGSNPTGPTIKNSNKEETNIFFIAVFYFLLRYTVQIKSILRHFYFIFEQCQDVHVEIR